MYEDDFESALSRILLVAYAHEVPLVGRRVLEHPDPGVPDFRVVVVDLDDDVSLGDATPPEGDDATFEAVLQDLILERYAAGEDPTGTWRASFPAPTVPDWRVEVSEREPEGW